MFLNREMAQAILDALDDPKFVETREGEAQVRVTEDPWDGAVWLGYAGDARWQGHNVGRAFNPCDAIFGMSDKGLDPAPK